MKQKFRESINLGDDIENAIDKALSMAIESFPYELQKSKIQDGSDMGDALQNSILIDETDLLEISIEDQIFLGTIYGEETGESFPETPFYNVEEMIRSKAIQGLYILTDGKIYPVIDSIDNLMRKEKLQYNKVEFDWKDNYDRLRPDKIDNLKIEGANVTVYRYREDGIVIDNYELVFKNKDNLTLYITNNRAGL